MSTFLEAFTRFSLEFPDAYWRVLTEAATWRR
jgi:hypothetical protein